MRKAIHGQWTHPDGGFGWIVVLASFLVSFIIYGQVFTWGLYQNALVKLNFDSVSKISLLGAISSAFLQAGSLFVKPCMKLLGITTIMLLGTVLFSLGLVLSSFAGGFWQMCVFQGALVGVGGALVFVPSVTIPSLWFLKKRGLAFGIIGTGTGVGGLMMSPVIGLLIQEIGLQQTLMMHGFFSLVLLLVVVPFIQLPAGCATEELMEESICSFKFLRRRPVQMFLLVCFFMPFGTTSPFYYLPGNLLI